MVLAEELGVLVLTPKFKRRDIDALEALFQRLERLGEGKQHQDSLQCLKEVLSMLVLPR